MTRRWAAPAIYAHIAGMTARIRYAYRFNLVVDLAGVLLQVALLKVVWTALYAQHGDVAGLSLHTLVAYLALTNLQLWLMEPIVASLMRQRVREGVVALDMTRPVGLLGQMIAQQCGATLGVLPFAVLAVPPLALLGGILPPASVGAALGYPLSLVLAFCVTTLLGLLIGLVAFWTLELGGFLGIYLFASQFFSGALVPLRFFPPVLHTLAVSLPFQAQAAIPLSIYLGQVRGADVLGDLGLQAFWVLALALVTGLVWRRAARHLVVQGG